MELLVGIGQYVQGHLLGIVISIAASIGAGFLWHGPLFGKQWMAYNKMTPPKREEFKFTMMLPGLVMSIIMVFVQASVLGIFLEGLAATVWQALIIAVIIWLPFMALTMANIYTWSGKPKGMTFLDAGYSLVSMLLTAAILYATL